MEKKYQKERERMVEVQIKARGIKNERVLNAIRKVPRHVFVPENMMSHAYDDEPLPIGGGQTISQPYIVAYMTEALQLNENMKVLEIGTGSGYQAAVLAELSKKVFSVEILSDLSKRAQKILKKLGYTNIQFKIGDGNLGWEEYAPFDAIIVTAAPSRVPEALQKQMKIQGKMVIPVGDAFQELVLIIRSKKKIKQKKLLPVRFVPLVTGH